jgi:hypothetical protein
VVYGTDTTKIVTYNPKSTDFDGAGLNGNLPGPAAGSQAVFNSATADNDCALLSRPTGTNKTAVTLDAGTFYTYTIAVGQGKSMPDGSWFGGFNTLVVDVGSGSNITGQEFPGGANPTPGTFKDFGIVFSADQFINGDTVNDGDALRFGLVIGEQTYADNVRVSQWSSEADAVAAEAAGGVYVDQVPAATPEPSTLALLATGLMGLLAYAWRKRK